MIDGISALAAPTATTVSLGPAATAAPSADASASASFSQVMSQVSGDVVGSLKAAEAASIQGLQGAAPVHKVVEAIMSAQRSLQSSLALRDKAVAAYQEISRMAI